MTLDEGAAGPPVVRRLVDRLVPWAVVPVPVLLAAIGVLWFLDVHSSFESRSLLTLLNFTFVTGTSAVIALLAARTFVATGSPGALFLGSGVLLMGAAFLAAPLAGVHAPNVTATVHNLGMLAAGVLSLIGAWQSYRPRAPVRAPAPALVAAYASSLGFVAGTAYLALAETTPTFFVQGIGGTPLRQVVLATGAGLFGAAGLGLILAEGNAKTFRRWYALGLALLGIGLLGVMLQETIGSPISWVGRIAQYLGSVYLLVASMASATEARRWGLPLEEELREEREQGRQLREARAQLARVLEGSNDGFWDWNLRNGQVDFSDRWAEMFGYRRSELAPSISTWQGMLHPEDREATRGFQKRVESGALDRYEAERRFRHKDGHWVWVLVRGKVVEREADGRPTRMAGTYTDITARKEAEAAFHESEERLSNVLDGSNDGFWDWDIPSGRVTFSQRTASILGRDLAELEANASTWDRLIHPDDTGRVKEAAEAHLRGDSDQFAIEHRVLHKDGRWIWILDRGKVVKRAPDGTSTRMAGTYTDITDRKRAEEAARRSELLFREAARQFPNGLLAVLDADLRHVLVDGEGLAQSGEVPSDRLGRTIAEVFEPETLAAIEPMHRAALAGRASDRDVPWRGRVIRVKTRPIGPDGDGRPRCLVMTQDVTEQARAVEALRASETRFRELFHAVPALLWTASPDGSVTDCNRAWCEFTGMTREQSLGNGWMEALPPEDRVTTRAAVADAFAQGSLYRVEQRLRRHDGEYRWFLTQGTPVRDSTGEVVRWHGANVDISERKAAEEALRKSEEALRSSATLLRVVTDSSPDAIFAKDREGRWTFANAAALRAVGKPAEEILGKLNEEILKNSTEARALSAHDRKVMESGVGHTFEERVSFATEVRTFLSSKAPLRDPEGRVVGIVGVAKDVTEIRRLEERLAVTARLAAMGTLVAGVAHEINNPLAAELAGQGFALEVARDARKQLQEGAPVDPEAKLKELEEVISALEDAQGAGRRIANIVRELALFARPTVTRSTIRLGDAVDLGVRWLPSSLFASADVEVEDHGSPVIVAAGGQIAQVVANLVSNAVKATRPGTRGKVVVRTGTGNEGRAILEVIDQGVGIAPELCPRVFDPFFTTRPVGEGRGSGLGLAVALTIVTSHGGTLTVESEVGKGSTFRAELPAAPAEA